MSVTVVALIPPAQGIRATLLSGGLSPVVVEDGGVFRTVSVRRDPDRVALSSPYAATGLLQLETEGGTRYLPFEGGGVSTGWMLEMPHASNAFDFSSIADVLVTVEYTALHSDTYRSQVIERLGNRLEAARPFSFRDDFADAWYDVLNGELLPTTPPSPETPRSGFPLPTRSWRTSDGPSYDVIVEVAVERTDFPPNLSDLHLRHAALYAVAVEDRDITGNVTVEFVPAGDVGEGDAAASFTGSISSRVLSSRIGGPSTWTPADHAPMGVWRLTFNPEAQEAMRDTLDDLLLVLSYHGMLPAWPL